MTEQIRSAVAGTMRARARAAAFTTAAVLGWAALAGCSSAAAEAGRGPMLVSSAELATELSQGTLVLHVHERENTYEAGHIPGARFLRYSSVVRDEPGDIGAELPPAADLQRAFEEAGVRTDRRVVIYSTSTVYAARVFFTLDATGHPDVAILDGGLAAWKADGHPVDAGPDPTHGGGAFTPVVNEQRMATADWIRERLGSGRVGLVDVRPDAEYMGGAGDRAMGSPGHLPGARQLTWNSLVGPDGRFLPREQLEQKLQAAGAAAGRPVVSYCMVGMRASVVYFVARYLGYDARLYDGSILDWGRRGYPVVKGMNPGQG
ncbi:MAG: sulfurtransferase [Vicinamibacterales bacterium]